MTGLTLGQFRTLTNSLPDSTPLVIAQFDPNPHASPQYYGLSVNTAQIQNMDPIGAWWHNPNDPNKKDPGISPTQVIFLNPLFPNDNA